MVKITVAGIGYVGLSNAVLLAQNNDVTAFDIAPEKVEKLNRHISPIVDRELEVYLKTRPLKLKATTDRAEAFADADFVVVATPTNYDPDTNFLRYASKPAFAMCRRTSSRPSSAPIRPARIFWPPISCGTIRRSSASIA